MVWQEVLQGTLNVSKLELNMTSIRVEHELNMTAT